MAEIHSDQWFDEMISAAIVPADIRRLAIRLCRSYGIGGICDPMYIANVIAVEMGRGDGKGKFDGMLPTVFPTCAAAEIKLRKTLVWVDRGDRWDGMERRDGIVNPLRFAVVFKDKRYV